MCWIKCELWSCSKYDQYEQDELDEQDDLKGLFLLVCGFCSIDILIRITVLMFYIADTFWIAAVASVASQSGSSHLMVSQSRSLQLMVLELFIWMSLYLPFVLVCAFITFYCFCTALVQRDTYRLRKITNKV